MSMRKLNIIQKIKIGMKNDIFYFIFLTQAQ